MAIKIHYIIINNFLAKKSDWIGAKKIIPEMSFFLCHILSESFCIFSKLRVVFAVHGFHLSGPLALKGAGIFARK